MDRGALDELDVGVVLVEEDGAIAHANLTAHGLVASLGARLSEHSSLETLLGAIAARLPVGGTTEVRAGDERVVSIRRTTSLLELRDVTSERRRDVLVQQAQKLEALGLLAGGIAHDFNNLLTAILGEAELLSSVVGADPDANQSVADIVYAGRRAAELTRDLLAFARTGDGERVRVDVCDMVQETMRLLGRSVDRRIRVVTAPGVPGMIVSTDPAQLQSALLNLALNARDAMPNGGTLTIGTRSTNLGDDDRASWGEELAPGEYVEIEVSDTGVGIPTELLPRIFEPFFTTKPRGEGTGLGLPSVRKFAESQGGAVRVWSEPGRGTTFRVLLPQAEGRESGPYLIDGAAPRGHGSVLVVDDEILVADVMRRSLERLGYDVTAVNGGEDALAAFDGRGRPFDLVLLDLNMPEMNGLTVFRHLRERSPKVPIVIVSGFGAPEVIRGVREAGARTFVTKPFRLEELARTVATELGLAS